MCQLEMTMEGNSDQLCANKEDNWSISSTCGSDFGINVSNNCLSTDFRSSLIDIDQTIEEKYNYEFSEPARVHWGEPVGMQSEVGDFACEQSLDKSEVGHLDHAYSKASFENKSDILAWYCLGTC